MLNKDTLFVFKPSVVVKDWWLEDKDKKLMLKDKDLQIGPLWTSHDHT